MNEQKVPDALREVATIAAGNAATALAKFTGYDVTVAVPTVHLPAIENILTEIGDASQLTSVMVVSIYGDMQGLFIFSLEPGHTAMVTKAAITQQLRGSYQDHDQSVLREVSNIIAGTALSSLDTFLDMRLMLSVPVSTTDMLGAVLDPFIAAFGKKFDKVLMQKEVFTLTPGVVRLNFLTIIDPISTNLMINKLTEKISPRHAGH